MPCIAEIPRRVIRFMDINIEVVDEAGLFNKIMHFVIHGKTHKVMYVNAHCMVVSQEDEMYHEILKKADLVYADGISLVWAGRLLGHHLPCRLTAADFMPRFFRQFSQKGLKIYLLGAEPHVAAIAAKRLQQVSPQLQIVGTHHGYFHSSESGRIIDEINNYKPHILMVGMGVPYQEKWIEQYHEQIDASVVWGVGALFDFLSGRLVRGPQWLLDNGFEWFCRLIAEPRRLGRRYVLGNLLFVWYAMQWRIKNKKTQP